ncbi:MAG: HEAT repeat domain-containing protein [Planctomycetota bacterium]|jgi:cyclophilin family peptidyl-prolyl cis-trans isomerase/HEAT repeat protein
MKRLRTTPAAAALIAWLLGAEAGAEELQTAVLSTELGRRYDEALLVRAAKSPNAATRRAAARAAARLKDERALAWLVPMVRDPVPPVRRTALFALGQIGAREAVIPIRSGLSDLKGANDLAVALEALGKMGDPLAVSTIVESLGHDSAAVRGEAALALFRIGDPSALPDLMTALHGERSDEPRWRMVYTAFRLLRERMRVAGGDPVKVDASWSEMLRMATQPSRPYHERVFAALGLGAVRGERKTLRALLPDGDPRVVVAAVRALAAAGWDSSDARRIVPLLQHEDALMREVALQYILSGEDQALPQMAVAVRQVAANPRLYLMARSAQARAQAAAGAGEPDAPQEGADPAHWEEIQWSVNTHFGVYPDSMPGTLRGKRAAAEACGEERVPKDRALPLLLTLLKSERDYTVRSTALASLAKRGDASQVAAIVAAAESSTTSRDMDVRIEAANALAELGTHHAWLDHAAAEDPCRPVRDAAGRALRALGRPLPTSPPPAGFQLHGHDAAGIAKAARALRGARVVFETNRGKIEMVLLPDEAPAHCVSFVTLIEQGFYRGLTWHRVVPDFVVQGGCPRGDGWGGPGYSLPDEIGTRPYVRGTVGMPKAGDDTGGCQVFITHLPTPHLDGRYSVFAQVISGLDVVDRIRIGDRIVNATVRLAAESAK